MILVGGKEFRTLQDEFFVNGSKCVEAYVNDVKVYPEETIGGNVVFKCSGSGVEESGSLQFAAAVRFPSDRLHLFGEYIDYNPGLSLEPSILEYTEDGATKYKFSNPETTLYHVVGTAECPCHLHSEIIVRLQHNLTWESLSGADDKQVSPTSATLDLFERSRNLTVHLGYHDSLVSNYHVSAYQNWKYNLIDHGGSTNSTDRLSYDRDLMISARVLLGDPRTGPCVFLRETRQMDHGHFLLTGVECYITTEAYGYIRSGLDPYRPRVYHPPSNPINAYARICGAKIDRIIYTSYTDPSNSTNMRFESTAWEARMIHDPNPPEEMFHVTEADLG